jgi:hypothetical protein
MLLCAKLVELIGGKRSAPLTVRGNHVSGQRSVPRRCIGGIAGLVHRKIECQCRFVERLLVR